MSASSSLVGLRRVIGPLSANRGFSSRVESTNRTPSSSRIRATPPISASVFLAGSDASSFISRQSGRIEEKMLACFTWPAIITSRTPSAFRISISRPNCPREIQWQRGASVSISDEASSLMPTATTSWPSFRALSSARIGKRPLPAMMAYFIP